MGLGVYSDTVTTSDTDSMEDNADVPSGAWRQQSSNFHKSSTMAHSRLPGKPRNRRHRHKQRHADASDSCPPEPATAAFWDNNAAYPCCFGKECLVKGKATVVPLMVCALVLSPRDGNYAAHASLVIIIQGSLICWCLFGMLAANDPARSTRVQAKGVERRSHRARRQYARDWALLHAHDDGLEMPWASEDNYSPY